MSLACNRHKGVGVGTIGAPRAWEAWGLRRPREGLGRGHQIGTFVRIPLSIWIHRFFQPRVPCSIANHIHLPSRFAIHYGDRMAVLGFSESFFEMPVLSTSSFTPTYTLCT